MWCFCWLTICLLCAEARARPSSVELRVTFISSTSSFRIFSFWASCWVLCEHTGRRQSTHNHHNEWMWCLLALDVQHVRLTPWPGCEAPRSPLPASGCCPPFPPPPASASSPPPAASDCSSEGRRRNTPTLTSHWGRKHTLSRKKTFISCRRHSILYYFRF